MSSTPAFIDVGFTWGTRGQFKAGLPQLFKPVEKANAAAEHLPFRHVGAAVPEYVALLGSERL